MKAISGLWLCCTFLFFAACSHLEPWFEELANQNTSTTAQKSVSRLAFTDTSYIMTVGETHNSLDWIVLTSATQDETDIQLFINNESFAILDETGLLTATAAGTTTLKATVGSLSDTATLTILPAAGALDGVSPAKAYGLITSPTPESLRFNLTNDDTSLTDLTADDLQTHLDCDLSFASSDDSVLSVDASGSITPLANGNATVTLSCAGDALAIEFAVDCFATTSESTTTETDNRREILMSVSIALDSEYEIDDTKLLKATLNFNTGSVRNVTRSFVTPLGNTGEVAWSSGNSKIQIENAVATFASYGAGSIELDVLDQHISTTVDIKMQNETPDSYSDHFLGYDDFPGYEDWEDDTCPVVDFGDNGGFAAYLCPEIFMNQPYGPLHVVSLGSGGEVTLTLNGYYPVDGPGPDFIVFSNPLLDGEDNSLFAERAQVSVSRNGSSYKAFDCDPFDPQKIYAGCAGVGLVDISADPLNAQAVGGDSFDLADLGLSSIRYLKITDLKTCVAGDDTYQESYGVPLCEASGKEGFDLDAIVILNGQRE